ATKLSAKRDDAKARIATLTPRQHAVMKLVVAGMPNKNIAADLGISQRTVENHRAVVMKKTRSKSLPELARLSIMATWGGPDKPVTHERADGGT
ncbi:MAG: LuxR C-terminal-related transcriptional regulator, partial [Rhodospirillaceae bacterium]